MSVIGIHIEEPDQRGCIQHQTNATLVFAAALLINYRTLCRIYTIQCISEIRGTVLRLPYVVRSLSASA